MQRNFYEVLGLQRTATKAEIKEKYYTLARLFHPDRAKDKVSADRLFVQINRAYSTLYNDVKRAKYDASLDAIDQVPNRPGTTAGSRPAASAQPITPQQVRTLFDQASRMQLSGDLAQAITLSNKVVEAEPNNLPGLILLGDLLAQTGKHQEALTIYERAGRIQPGNLLLREKTTRLRALIERRTTAPDSAANRPPTAQPAAHRPMGAPTTNGNGAASSNGTQRPPLQKPPLQAPPVAQRPPTPTPPPAKPAAPAKSLFDRLLNRK
jgi:curved DNA-binding protein CbpA